MAVADFHGESNGDHNLERFLKNGYDLLLIVGDFTDMGPASQAEEILSRIDETGVSVLAVPGNCDPKSVKEILEDRNVSLHSKSVQFEDLTFVGFGGSNTTPFNTPFELTEGEIEEELNPLVRGLGGNWILVTHAPPYGTLVDLMSDDIHAGSKSVRKLIEKRQPLINFCAHIHEARNLDRIGRTKIVNPGPITGGYAAEAIFDEDIKVNLLKL